MLPYLDVNVAWLLANLFPSHLYLIIYQLQCVILLQQIITIIITKEMQIIPVHIIILLLVMKNKNSYIVRSPLESIDYYLAWHQLSGVLWRVSTTTSRGTNYQEPSGEYRLLPRAATIIRSPLESIDYYLAWHKLSTA